MPPTTTAKSPTPSPARRPESSRSRARLRFSCWWRTSRTAQRPRRSRSAGAGTADDLPPAEHARGRGPAGQGRPPALHPRAQHRDPGAGIPAREGGARQPARGAAGACPPDRGDLVSRRLGRARDPRPCLRGGQPHASRRRGGERAYEYGHARANGKVLLAYARPEIRDAYLRAHPLRPADPDSTICDRQALERELERILRARLRVRRPGVRGRGRLRGGAAARTTAS